MNLKQWLTGARTEHKWGCYECLFPQCSAHDGDTRCVTRPTHAIKHNALVEGKYYCLEHRYPPCSGPNCTSGVDGGPKRRVPSGKIRFKPWTCDDCQKRNATGSQPTTTDGATNAEAEAPAPNVSTGDAVPSTQTDKRKSDAMFECSFCKKWVHASQVCKQGHHNTMHGQTRCLRCACPTCEVCGKEQKEPLTIKAIQKYKTSPDAPWCYADPNPRLEQTSPRPRPTDTGFSVWLIEEQLRLADPQTHSH